MVSGALALPGSTLTYGKRMAYLAAQGSPASPSEAGNTLLRSNSHQDTRITSSTRATALEEGSVMISHFTDEGVEAGWSWGSPTAEASPPGTLLPLWGLIHLCRLESCPSVST